MSSDLIEHIEWDLEEIFDRPTPKGKIPLYIDVEATDPECIPILVSGGSRPCFWYTRILKSKVRAAVRREGLETFQRDVVKAVEARGRREKWGNTFAWDQKGIEAAILYVQSYDLSEIVLIAPSSEMEYLNTHFSQHTVESADWIDEGCIVVIPQDRSYLGWVAILNGTGGYFVSVVHNPSRGMSIVRKREKLAESGDSENASVRTGS